MLLAVPAVCLAAADAARRAVPASGVQRCKQRHPGGSKQARKARRRCAKNKGGAGAKNKGGAGRAKHQAHPGSPGAPSSAGGGGSTGGGASTPSPGSPSGEGPPSGPPQTTIDSAPTGFVAPTSTQEVRFHSDQPGAGFECRLGEGTFAPCASPWSFDVGPAGDYEGEVRAVSADGSDPTPATFAFTAAEPEQRCGALSHDETWSTAQLSGVVLSCTVEVPAGITLTLGPGLFVKVATASNLRILGSLQVIGTPAAPVALTSLRDDSVGGDTNDDGAASHPVEGSWPGIVAESGSSVGIDDARIRFARQAVDADEPSHLSLADSVLADTGAAFIRGCEHADFSANTFAGTALVLDSCPATVAGNSFEDTPEPLAVSSDPDLSGLDFSAASKNTFAGSGSERLAKLSGTVPAGSSWQLDAGNVVYSPRGVDVRGTVAVGAGAVIKTDQGIQDRGGGFSVNEGGKLSLLGSAQAPVTATSMADDTIAGDSGGDGPSDPSKGSWASGLVSVNDGGDLEVHHAEVRWLVYPLITEYEAAGQITVTDSTFSTPEPIDANGIEVDTGAAFIRGCEHADFSANTFAGTALVLDSCPATVAGGSFDRGISISRDDASLSAVAISNHGGVALAVSQSSVSVGDGEITDAATGIDAGSEANVAYRGSITSLSGERWVKACRWEPETDCGVDASNVDWGVQGPMPTSSPSRVCGQVLVDPWVGMEGDADVFRAPNCDGSVYRPNQQLGTASAYANQRLADVYAMCDPNEPLTADACEVYERFQACYGAAIGLAKAGSTFLIPDTPNDVASGLAGSLSNGLASSPDPFVAADGHLFQRLTGLLQVIGIASALTDAYYSCAP
ncbi:MAG TPA: hypothetical protein VJQ84_03085 [Solirubrobacterales bacterium]|nr:hypothetical protein [Solirubrobacterales bacterium]